MVYYNPYIPITPTNQVLFHCSGRFFQGCIISSKTCSPRLKDGFWMMPKTKAEEDRQLATESYEPGHVVGGHRFHRISYQSPPWACK